MARPREFDEEQALEKVLHLFWTKGYEATSISDLEEHLGLGRQSIYNVFGDKREVFLKALQSYVRSSDDRIAALLLHGNGGLESIRAYLLASVQTLTSFKTRRACLIVNTVMENATADPEIGATCRGSHQRMIRGFRAALERAIGLGEISSKTDVGTTATMLAAQAYGLSVLAKSGLSLEELNATASAFVDGLQ